MLSIDAWHRPVRITGSANFLVGALLFAWPLLLTLPLDADVLKRSSLVAGTLAAVCGGARAVPPERPPIHPRRQRRRCDEHIASDPTEARRRKRQHENSEYVEASTDMPNASG